MVEYWKDSLFHWEQGDDGQRFMLGKKKAEVRDLSGKVWKKEVEVEQCAVAGYGNSVVYWKICS